MRFLMIYHPDLATLSQPPSAELQTQMGRLIEESMRAGILLSTGGASGGSAGIRVRRAAGKVTITDGPYAEAKELIGGYALCELPSKESAIEFAQRFLAIVGSGESEIHQLDS